MSLIKIENIESFVSQFLGERGVDLKPTVFSKTNFLNSGLIDSFSQLQLLMELQDRYSVEITPEDILTRDGMTYFDLVKLILDRAK